MNLKFLKLLFYSLIVLCATSCKKDIDVFIPDVVVLNGEVSDIFAAFGTSPDKETFNVNSDNWIRVSTANASVIEAQSESFELPDGSLATGDIRLEITELFSKGEILMYGIETISEGRILESDGELIIRAFQGDQELSLAPGKRINIKVSNPNPREEMELFYGQTKVDPAGVETRDWLEADGDSLSTANVWESQWEDSVRVGFGYECFSDSLDFVNIDYFTKFDLDLTQACVNLPNGYDTDNTVVFAVFDDYNIVLSLAGNPDLEMFCANLPVGENVQFIVTAAEDEDTFHFGTASSTIDENLFVEIIPEETPIDDIKAYLMSL
jgi:outer membrane protein assembly factor BamB